MWQYFFFLVQALAVKSKRRINSSCLLDTKKDQTWFLDTNDEIRLQEIENDLYYKYSKIWSNSISSTDMEGLLLHPADLDPPPSPWNDTVVCILEIRYKPSKININNAR